MGSPPKRWLKLRNTSKQRWASSPCIRIGGSNSSQSTGMSRRKFCTGAKGFNADTQSCCERHDRAYSEGSNLSRMDADIDLLLCVAARGMPWRAIAMFVAVRCFGWMLYKGSR